MLVSLLREGLLPGKVVDAPGFRIVDRAARVECFEFIAPDGTGLVVKRGFDRDGRAALRRETSVLRDLARAGRAEHLRRALPTLRRLHRHPTWLVEERVATHGPLDAAMAGGFSLPVARFGDLGRAVAELHRMRGGEEPPRSRGKTPWPFALASPPPLELLHEATPASLETIRLVQRHPELHRPLRAMAGEWRPVSRIHGDLRWENILVGRRAGAVEFRIIDWEASCRGDAAWDLGAFLGESLRVWLFADRIAPRKPFGPPPLGDGNARNPALSSVAPFWEGYREGLSAAEREEADALLTRSVRFASVWLLGRVYELAGSLSELDARCRQSLQLVANVLADPEKASRDLFRCGGEGSRG